MAERTATPGIPKIVAKCEKGGRATWCRLQMRGFKKNAKKLSNCPSGNSGMPRNMKTTKGLQIRLQHDTKLAVIIMRYR